MLLIAVQFVASFIALYHLLLAIQAGDRELEIFTVLRGYSAHQARRMAVGGRVLGLLMLAVILLAIWWKP